jgi:hypothetical protein
MDMVYWPAFTIFPPSVFRFPSFARMVLYDETYDHTYISAIDPWRARTVLVYTTICKHEGSLEHEAWKKGSCIAEWIGIIRWCIYGLGGNTAA